MTGVDPEKMREACELIRQFSHPDVHDLVDAVETLLLRQEAMLLLHERMQKLTLDIMDGPMGEVIPLHPGHSVRV